MEVEMSKKFGIGAFLLGGVVGAAIGLLYAPKPGVETRAAVADKVDELWGQSQTLYTQGKVKVQETVATVSPAIKKQNDELREKIETARSLIADQVAKNAAAARDIINDKVPVAAEKINQVADVVRGQIDAAATALKGKTAEVAADAPAIDAPAEPSAVVE
jgi:gas vesicle protein